MSARSFEAVTPSTEGPTAPVRRPVFEVINGGAQPQIILGERPTPQAHPADEGYTDEHFDRPAKKFELAGDSGHLPRAEVMAPVVDWSGEEEFLAKLAMQDDWHSGL